VRYGGLVKRLLLLIAILIPGPAAAGLFGSDAPGRIPVPARLFAADIEDVDGVTLHVGRLTFDGEVFLFGTVGRAQVTVPFEQVDQVEFRPTNDADFRIAVVRLRSGAPALELRVEADRPLFGLAVFGNYRLAVGDARRITVLPERQPGSDQPTPR
jgi:hypothetical protein